jgi:3'-phosphoadenosine 5'-phosphosulfate (PAPS) 3'-phosphatase
MLEQIAQILERAVLLGAAEVLALKRAGTVHAEYKDATELVTEADRRSDAAILNEFRTSLTPLDPEIVFHLEESGHTGTPNNAGKVAGADPIDGTNHFACGGQSYSIQAHYVENGIPKIGIILQPEVYLPLSESDRPIGRIVRAITGAGADTARTEFIAPTQTFTLSERRRLTKSPNPSTKSYVACVPLSTKMTADEKARALRVYNSGLISVTTGLGGAAANILMTIFGGQQVYANFGAGEDLDLIPGQVIATEAGMVVWDLNGNPPQWEGIRKQPFLIAPDEAIARRFLNAAITPHAG